jgi:hypothetical protein
MHAHAPGHDPPQSMYVSTCLRVYEGCVREHGAPSHQPVKHDHVAAASAARELENRVSSRFYSIQTPPYVSVVLLVSRRRPTCETVTRSGPGVARGGGALGSRHGRGPRPSMGGDDVRRRFVILRLLVHINLILLLSMRAQELTTSPAPEPRAGDATSHRQTVGYVRVTCL